MMTKIDQNLEEVINSKSNVFSVSTEVSFDLFRQYIDLMIEERQTEFDELFKEHPDSLMRQYVMLREKRLLLQFKTICEKIVEINKKF